MADMFDYIKKYGDVNFFKKDFNIIDSMILSVVAYCEFEGIVSPKKNKVSLNYALKKFLETVDYKGFIKRGFCQKDIYKVAKALIDKKRYRDIALYNYVYKVTFDEQFCAVTMKLPNGITYVAFEGTDHNLVGWEEDAALCYKYPVPAQIDAINYLNKTLGIFDTHVIIGGHSKGGHLSLVSAMHANFWNKGKIKEIHNFDGPGLRKREIESDKYKKLRDKYTFMVPAYSIVGMLLRHDPNYVVVDASRRGFLAHFPTCWQIKDDQVEVSELSRISTKLEKSMLSWLENHNDQEREKMFKGVFDFIRSVGIDSVADLKKVKYLFSLVKESKNLDKESKDLFIDFLKFNLSAVLEKEKKVQE